MTNEQRRRLRLERAAVRAWRQGMPIAAVADQLNVEEEWVAATIKRAHRGTLRMERGR